MDMRHAMLSFLPKRVRGALMASMALGISACGAPAPGPVEPHHFAGFGEEPEFFIDSFDVMAEASFESRLPRVVDAAGSAISGPCFEAVLQPRTWETSNPQVLGILTSHRGDIERAILHWMLRAVMTGIPVGSELDHWRVSYERPYVVQVDQRDLALDGDQSCIDASLKSMPVGSRVITTLFGARVFSFRSPRPLQQDELVAMRKAAARENMQLKPVNAYTPAVDRNGKPRRGPKRERLFNSPGGELIPMSKVPPPNKRAAIEWRLIARRPLCFARGDMPPTRWRQESDPLRCEVYVVYDDVTPQVPECSGMGFVGFGVRRGKEANGLVVYVAADGDLVQKEISFGNAGSLTVGGRTVVWVTAEKLEEGARLRIDSLMLETGKPHTQPAAFPPPKKRKSTRPKKRRKPREKKPLSDPGIRF